MFGGQICVLMGSVVLLLFVPVLRCMISAKSNLFNNFMLLIMFKIFYVHFYRPMAIFVVCYTSLVVSVAIFTQWHKMLKKSIIPLPWNKSCWIYKLEVLNLRKFIFS